MSDTNTTPPPRTTHIINPSETTWVKLNLLDPFMGLNAEEAVTGLLNLLDIPHQEKSSEKALLMLSWKEFIHRDQHHIKELLKTGEDISKKLAQLVMDDWTYRELQKPDSKIIQEIQAQMRSVIGEQVHLPTLTSEASLISIYLAQPSARTLEPIFGALELDHFKEDKEAQSLLHDVIVHACAQASPTPN